MIYAVFLCDTKWKIKLIRQSNGDLFLHKEEFLTDLVREREELQNNISSHYSLRLTFSKQEITVSAIIDSFKEGSLVILAQINNEAEFIEFQNVYSQYLEWAKNHLLGLFHNEYFLIQQVNNQLVDAQRKLTRSNRQLEYTLKENKEINEKLELARVAAERANSSKTKFLANMSHDIRTPMNAIIGLTELMQHHLDEPEILKNYISKLQSSGHYLLDLLNDILDLSKIESGSLELKPEVMDIGEQVEQVITIMRPRIDKKKQNLSVQSECTEFGYLMGDPVRFRQILMNLFSNAVKYTPEGGKIRFRIRELERNAYARKYQFMIEDNGIGMTQEFLEHIFDPFARAESDVASIQGTGLGMAITKSIVDAMGGTVHVESMPGKGSCFCIELSFENCPKELLPEMIKKDRTDTENSEEISLRGMKFLCAEDNELNAEILQAMLELEGAECTVYENGKLLTDAFETVQPGKYSAILMDLQMPVMNGYEAARTIRNSRNPLGKTIPIIAMTANAFSEDIQHCIEMGMNAHIAKPIDRAVFKNTVCQVWHDMKKYYKGII